MAWMRRDPDRRAHPRSLWPEARSVILLGTNAFDGCDPLASLAEPACGNVAVYARRRDYHDVIKGRLKQMAGAFAGATGAGVKVFVDTAPVMEKPLAEKAGLGWQGKHTVLVSRTFGNWLLLGAIYTDLALPTDPPGRDLCGSCRHCLDSCPTDAFPAPYRLDARRCIAYLTIEHHGPIPRELRAKFGNRIFGCDDCLAVCPWNRFAQASRDARLAAREGIDGAPLAELAALDDAAFRARFSGTPIKRTGRARFLRNVAIAMGNSGDSTLLPAVELLLDDAAPLVRGAAIWAYARLAPPGAVKARAERAAADRADPDLDGEWRAALGETA